MVQDSFATNLYWGPATSSIPRTCSDPLPEFAIGLAKGLNVPMLLQLSYVALKAEDGEDGAPLTLALAIRPYSTCRLTVETLSRLAALLAL
ncbi:hypothetical protein ACG7TL_001662 [Trametes sanguinea]